jgi:ketosteroid isomerase-like protein
VSASDVDTVSGFLASLSRGDLATCQTLVTDDLIFSEAPSLPFGGDYDGPDGLTQLLAALTRDFSLRLEEPRISAAGDQVLVRVNGTIRARTTGATMPLEALDLYTLRDGLISRVDVYYKDAAAVTALMTGSAA